MLLIFIVITVTVCFPTPAEVELKMIQAEHAKVAEEAAKAAASKESAHAKLEAIKKKQVRDADNCRNKNSDRFFVVIDCVFEAHQSSLLHFT